MKSTYSISGRSNVLLRTIFPIPNIHCPTCVSHIKSLMTDIHPAPTVQSISIVHHVATILHDPSVYAATIKELLTSVGYEIFDIILDPASNEDLESFSLTHEDRQLDAAIHRWNPRQPQIDAFAQAKHNVHCQMCAAQNGARAKDHAIETITVEDSVDSVPKYLAILSIEGMTCSSCVGNAARALKELSFVERADVTLVSHSAHVQIRASNVDNIVKDLIEAVEDVGYGASLVEVKPLSSIDGRNIANRKGDMWRSTYSVEGMTCSSCVGAITKAVEELAFVRRVDINLAAHAGNVVFEGKENESDIQAAIDDIGYSATLTDLNSLAKIQSSNIRTVSLRIDGMHCPRCPERILAAIRRLDVNIVKPITLQSPILTIAYVPNAPELMIRQLITVLSELDQSFSVSIQKPISIEQRSKEMLRRERRGIVLRALLSSAMAIPTLIIGVVYMDLVSHSDSGYKYLMQPLHNVSRAQWPMFITASPVYFFAADHFHKRALKEIWALWRPRSPVKLAKRFYRFGSMNMLISLGTTIAYFSSLAELVVAATNSSRLISRSSDQSYFDSVVFLTFFLLLGRLAEAHMKAKSGDAIDALGKLRPNQANLLVAIESQNEETSSIEQIDADLLDAGDMVRIFQGSSPPCDGVLSDDNGQFDESSLTGESKIVHKKKGDSVFSGTINKGSAVTMQVTGAPGASMLDSIIAVVREGQSKRAPLERVADLLTAYFVPVIVVIAIATWMVWLALGLSGSLPQSYMDSDVGGWEFWSLQFAIAVFVIACPCGLGLAAPTALFVGGGLAAKQGILVKGGGEAFQEASNLDVVVFDKTGTLTEGKEPAIVKYRIFQNDSELDELSTLGFLKAAEEHSSHPLARAAVAFCTNKSKMKSKVVAVDEISGKGLKATLVLPEKSDLGSIEVLLGNEDLLQDYDVVIPVDAMDLLYQWKSAGSSVILLAHRMQQGWRLGGIFAAADPLRSEAAEVVAALQARRVDVWMLSGDNPITARAVGAQVGIPPENIIAGVLPAGKALKIQDIQKSFEPRRGRGLQRVLVNKRERAIVAMVGDGINDAPALAAADVGIAVASGSDVAVQSAAFVLVHSDLRAVLTLVTLSRVVFRRVILNFFWAAVYNIIALPIAAGVLYPITTAEGHHVRLDPAWAALAMALSSITVISNSLLLRTKIPLVGFRG